VIQAFCDLSVLAELLVLFVRAGKTLF